MGKLINKVCHNRLDMIRQGIIATMVVIVCIFLVQGFISSVHALDENEFFETARGKLLEYYSSEIVAHSGIILGLIIGLFALIAAWNSFWQEEKKMPIGKYIFFLLIGLALSLTLYSVSRLFYWSYLSTQILQATKSDFSFDSSNATGLIWQLTTNATASFWNNDKLQNILSQKFYLNLENSITAFPFLIRIIYFAVLPLLFWYFSGKKIPYCGKTLGVVVVTGILALAMIVVMNA